MANTFSRARPTGTRCRGLLRHGAHELRTPVVARFVGPALTGRTQQVNWNAVYVVISDFCRFVTLILINRLALGRARCCISIADVR